MAKKNNKIEKKIPEIKIVEETTLAESPEELTMSQKGLTKLKMEKVDLSEAPSKEGFEINQLQYDAFIKSHLEVKEKLYNSQKDFTDLRINVKMNSDASLYKSKYWICSDSEFNETYIQEKGGSHNYIYEGILSNAEVLKEYLNDKN